MAPELKLDILFMSHSHIRKINLTLHINIYISYIYIDVLNLWVRSYGTTQKRFRKANSNLKIKSIALIKNHVNILNVFLADETTNVFYGE